MAVFSGRTGQLGRFGYGPHFLFGQVSDGKDQFGKLGLTDLAQKIGLVFHVVGRRAQQDGLSFFRFEYGLVSGDADSFLEAVGCPVFGSCWMSSLSGAMSRNRQSALRRFRLSVRAGRGCSRPLSGAAAVLRSGRHDGASVPSGQVSGW